MRTLAIVSSYAAFVLCSALPLASAAPRPKDGDGHPLYHPVEKGLRGVYDEGRWESAWEVTNVEVKGAETIVTVSSQSNGKWHPWHKVSISAKGLYKLEIGKFQVDRFCLLRFPVKVGDSWSYEVAEQPAGLRGEKGTIRVGAVEEVEVPAGKFKALRVDQVVQSTNGNPLAEPERFTHWYDPEIGLVKMTSNQGFSRVLKSVTRPRMQD